MTTWIVFALVASPSHATRLKSHTVVVQLLERPEPDPYGHTHGILRAFNFHQIRPRGADDSVVTDDGKLSIECGVFGRFLSVAVSYHTGNYPEHLPESLGCVIGNIDLTVQFVGRPPLYDDVEDLLVGPDRPAEWRMQTTIDIESGQRQFALPAGSPWIEGTVPAVTDDGQPWKGVSCVVRHIEPGPLLVVTVADTREIPTSGRCPLPIAEGAPVAIPVQIVAR